MNDTTRVLLFGEIRDWSWLKACRSRTLTGGTVQEAADHLGLAPLFVRDLIGRDSPYFYIAGPDDDFSKMTLEHDGE